ncbi:6-phosphogluconolactonase [Phenylobacterium sp.]|jgi:6-phosphogluconolactonase|uniref:6-phosphogluconolactonase n=1 Tax=Phenylobacterium sp. TaxID=1871053 RepID=UPI003783AC68
MIETYPTAEALAEAAAHGVAAQLARGLKTRGRAALVATGGRSPGGVYDRLTAADVDWARIIVTLSDERCVPPDDAASNARLVRERLFTGEGRKAHLLPLWPEPEAGALEALLPFDAVLLGMGEDGHVASLFPSAAALGETERLSAWVPEGLGAPPLARITLTLPALTQAREVFVLIAGDAKRTVVERALAGDDLPVRRILVQDKVPVRVLWAPEH